MNPSSVRDSDKITAVQSTAEEKDPSQVLNEHVEDQIDAQDVVQPDLQDEAGTPATDTVQPLTVHEYHESTGTEEDQSAMDGAEHSANRKHISDIPDGAQPSRTF